MTTSLIDHVKATTATTAIDDKATNYYNTEGFKGLICLGFPLGNELDISLRKHRVRCSSIATTILRGSNVGSFNRSPFKLNSLFAKYTKRMYIHFHNFDTVTFFNKRLTLILLF